MKLILTEPDCNWFKVIKGVNETVYVDCSNKPAFKIIELYGKKYIFDIERKRERRRLNFPLIYNIYNIGAVRNSKRKKTIVFVETEKEADKINKKSKTLVATTVCDLSNRIELSRNVLELFRDTNIIVALSKHNTDENVHVPITSQLCKVAKNIDVYNYATDDVEYFSKEQCRIAKILC